MIGAQTHIFGYNSTMHLRPSQLVQIASIALAGAFIGVSPTTQRAPRSLH